MSPFVSDIASLTAEARLGTVLDLAGMVQVAAVAMLVAVLLVVGVAAAASPAPSATPTATPTAGTIASTMHPSPTQIARFRAPSTAFA